FPVEERKVPASDVPGEEAWPTQPFPLKPEPYSRQFMTANDLTNFSADAHDSLLKIFNGLRYEGLFTPPSTKGALNLPGTIGGSEWGGAAYDPATGVLYLKSNDAPEIDLLQKVQPGTKPANHLGSDAGKKSYMTYCVSCHKENREGDEPLYPSLIDIEMRMTKKEALNKIKQGGARMPAFAGILNGQEEAIISFLFDRKKKNFLPKEAVLSEIKNNISSHIEVVDVNRKNDTFSSYLNLNAYAQFKDINGNPSIRPPWGTLNAINLNTGEYEWKISVGNNAQLQEKGAGITGLWSSPGPIVTAGGLVLLGGTKDKKFFAFDKTTGKLLWETILPGRGSSTPSTYMIDDKQYIALSAEGDKKNPAGYIIAFALP
ncbi:MAG: c-type cytochrome, partial [Ginsengibacter sp.]